MKLLNTLSFALITSLVGLGCGAPSDYDLDDSDLGAASQESGLSLFSTVTITGFSTDSLEVQGQISGFGGQTLWTIAIPVIGGTGMPSLSTQTTSHAKSASATKFVAHKSGVVDGKCGQLVDEWSSVVNRKNWDAAKKYDQIVKVLLPKIAKNECSADITWHEDDGVNYAVEFAFPAAY